MSNTRPLGEYHRLYRDGDGEPCAHYVNGHVTDEQFRAAVAAYFAGSRKPLVVPADAKIEQVYVRVVRAPAEADFDTEWRQCAKSRGAFPMTVWNLEPHRGEP